MGASRFGLRLGRIGKSHSGSRRALDLLRGKPEDRPAFRLEPLPTVVGKAIQGVAVMTHVPRVLRQAAVTFDEQGQP